MKPTGLVKGKPFPVAPTYAKDSQARAFWRLSFKVPRDYCHGSDARGEAIIVEHEREENVSITRRRRITKAWNYVGPILRRYNDFVFRVHPQRDAKASDLVKQLVADADGDGTDMDTFFRRSLLRAQIERESYIVLARTGPELEEGQKLTEAQASELGVRPYLRSVGADEVLWWHNRDSNLDSCAVLMVHPDDGRTFVRIFERTTSCDVQVDQATVGTVAGVNGLVVADIGPDVAHGYKSIPVVRDRPMFDDAGSAEPTESQAAPIAEQQQAIANYLSLVNEDIYDCQFSQWVATGVSATEVKDAPVGSKRVLCLPNAQAGMTILGANANAGDSIRKQITEARNEIYRASGLNPGNPTETGQAESGVSKAFRFNDLSANLSALADSTERAENQVLKLVSEAYGKPVPAATNYPADFDAPDFNAEVDALIRVLAPPSIPATIKRKAVERFMSRNLKLDTAEEKILRAEIDAIGKGMLGDGNGSFPPGGKKDAPGTEGTPTPKPGATDPKKAATADANVQGTGLNGAQISSMMEIILAVVGKQMPPDTGKAMLKQAFPLMDAAAIDSMVSSAAKFTPAEPEPAKQPAPFAAS